MVVEEVEVEGGRTTLVVVWRKEAREGSLRRATTVAWKQADDGRRAAGRVGGLRVAALLLLCFNPELRPMTVTFANTASYR